jgi:hypothetical protein
MLKPTGFFSSLFVDVGAHAIAADTSYLTNRSLWVAHVRSDVAKAVVRSVVLAFCEEKLFRVAFETKSDCELEHATEKRAFLLRFGRTADHGDHVVLGDFTHTDGVDLDAAALSASVAAPASAADVLDEKTHASLAGVDNPLRSYFHLFFDELAQKLVRACLLRSYDAVPLPPSVLDLHRVRVERQKAESAASVGKRRLPGVRWAPEERDWRASLRGADTPAAAKAIRDEAVRLFCDYVGEQKFVVTQFQPSLVCELPPNDVVEQCTVRMRAATSKANAGLIIVAYEMTPAHYEGVFFTRFFDSFTKILERNDLLQLSRMVERRRALRSLTTAYSNAKTAAGREDAKDDDDDDDDDDSDDNHNETEAQDSNGQPKPKSAKPAVAPATEFAGLAIVRDGSVSVLPDPKEKPSEFQAIMQRAQKEARSRVTPAAVKPPAAASPKAAAAAAAAPAEPRRSNGVIVEALEGFTKQDRGEELVADVSTEDDEKEASAPPPPPPPSTEGESFVSPRSGSIRKVKPPPPKVPPPPPAVPPTVVADVPDVVAPNVSAAIAYESKD